MRTSTAEVERRQFRRFAVDLTARLSLAGKADCGVRISDLSEGGSCVNSAPEVPSGTRGTLHIDGMARSLACTVRATDGNGLHLAFEQDDTTTNELRVLFDGAASRPAA